MIESVIINYLTSDATLDALLGASGSNPKIYPNQMPHGTIEPFIIYKVSGEGTREENSKEITMSFNCKDSDYNTAGTVRDRVSDMLDRQDEIQGLISDATYKIFWSKKIGGSDSKDSDLDLFEKEVIINFKYMPKVLP